MSLPDTHLSISQLQTLSLLIFVPKIKLLRSEHCGLGLASVSFKAELIGYGWYNFCCIKTKLKWNWFELLYGGPGQVSIIFPDFSGAFDHISNIS